MARMVPETLLEGDYDPASLEDRTFEKLKALPDGYCVFHSVRVSGRNEREIDFLVYAKDKGVLCLESKAGQVSYANGTWLYANGDPMKGRGPYNQSRSAMYALLHKLEDFCGRHSGDVLRRDLSRHVQFQFGVCFPSVARASFNRLPLPPGDDSRRTLTADELDPARIQSAVDALFSLPSDYTVRNPLDDQRAKVFFDEFLCPAFSIVPSPAVERDDRERQFLRLLGEQANVLNYLCDQRSVAICGAAGTGKTMIALEKAKKEARNGKKVLFLCFNSFLKTHLEQICERDGFKSRIDVQTIDGYACSVCRSAKANYGSLVRELEAMFDNDSFPYDNVVVDEAQDFGTLGNNGECYDVLETIKMCVERKTEGSIFLFYDRLQMVQANRLPSVIEDADCKLTLYENCRNTRNIAKTSVSLLSSGLRGRRPTAVPSNVPSGKAPVIRFATDEAVRSCVEDALGSIRSDATIKDVVVLTCKTETTSALAPFFEVDNKNRTVFKFANQSYLVTTCRKFKGLEADAVVLVDVDRSTLLDESGELLFYVGSSRARYRLEIVTTAANADLRDFLVRNGSAPRPGRELRKFLDAVNCTTI